MSGGCKAVPGQTLALGLRVRSLRLTAGFLGATLLLTACSFTSDALWPSLSGEPARQPVRVEIPPSQAELQARAKPVTAAPAVQAAPAPMQAVAPAAPTQIAQAGGGQPPAGQPTGTLAGQKGQQLRAA